MKYKVELSANQLAFLSSVAEFAEGDEWAGINDQLNNATDITDVIEISWSKKDIIHQAIVDRVKLTGDQVSKVMDLLVRHHDANEGINWGVISAVISTVKSS